MQTNGPRNCFIMPGDPFRSIGVSPLKMFIAVLVIGLLIGVSTAADHPSFTSLSDFNFIMLANVVDDAINYCGKAIGSLVAIYQDFMASSKIVYFFKSSLPLELKPGTTILLVCGLVGLWGCGRWRRSRSR